MSTPEEQADREALVPGTPDEQIVSDRNDSAPTTTVDLAEDVEKVLKTLDGLIQKVGEAISEAFLHDESKVRQAVPGLRNQLAALEGAHAAVASSNDGATVSVHEGVA